MELQDKSALVLGAPGMVGREICHALLQEGVSTLILSSLYEHESTQYAETLKQEFGKKAKIIAVWGNIFVRRDLKDLSRQELISNPKARTTIITDTLEPLSREILTAQELYQLTLAYKPDLIVDAVNSATAFSYQNLFAVSKEALLELQQSRRDKRCSEELSTAVEKLLMTQYTPQLIRHIQILLQSMTEAGTKIYLKIGTCGTGGMGLNIPYTHSEDKPSQLLLSKAALAGAHSLLLFLMGRTAGGPIIKELKPAAAIAWKQVTFGPVTRHGKPILLEDVSVSDAISIGGKLSKTYPKKIKNLVITSLKN